MILVLCIFILLYGLVQYLKGHKGRGAFVFFFFITEGFHFLNLSWSHVKYADFAVAYLLVVTFHNLLTGNRAFFRPQIKIYKVAAIIGLFITLEFVRTVILNEEIFSLALSNYRTYIPILSFWLVQELKEREIKSLFKIIASITIISTVLFDLQPLLDIKILQHASVGSTRYRNIPYLAYFFMLLASIRLDFNKWKSIGLVLVFVIALVLTQHRAVMMGYVFVVGIYLLTTKNGGRFVQYGMIGLVVFLFAGESILSRFDKKGGQNSTLNDIQVVLNLNYRNAVYNEYENEGGTLSFRVLLLMERFDYMITHPRYTLFGIGTRHEDSPRTQQQFHFILGSHRSSNDSKGMITSGDLAWLKPLMRFGFFGIGLFLYLSWVTVKYLYRKRKDSDIAMSAFLFYLLLLIISFKNDHLYGNMQMFFIYLLIEYIRYSNVKLKVKNKES